MRLASSLQIIFSICERWKGYSAKALAMALDICREKGLKRVLATCDRENTSSVRTILKCGGVLENEIFDPNDGTMTQRCWFDIDACQ